jgi:uncharacterized protein (DUF4415 family)
MRTSRDLAQLPAISGTGELVRRRQAAISLRVDEDVLAWFRSLGPRYQTRMNAVLRAYMKRTAHRARRPGARPGSGAA